ncbi:MAG: hypothetical protein JXM74_02995 [Fusobacteriaceae bacterium]|nr:hypothetical protein [Fusobacteriaceae bacterium]MBN2837698.1 hypothetical protein [Fusobacteriaceae bacterium]
MKKVVILVSFLTFIISCTSLQTANNKGLITHEIEYTAKGSKSEGQIGKLKVNGIYIPTLFAYVSDSKTSYEFVSNNNTWGKHQYFPLDEKLYISKTNEVITSKDIENGFYLGIAQKKNTPNNWIKVQWSGGEAFIDTNKINTVLKKEPFKSLKDYSEHDFIYNGPGIIKN